MITSIYLPTLKFLKLDKMGILIILVVNSITNSINIGIKRRDIQSMAILWGGPGPLRTFLKTLANLFVKLKLDDQKLSGQSYYKPNHNYSCNINIVPEYRR